MALKSQVKSRLKQTWSSSHSSSSHLFPSERHDMTSQHALVSNQRSLINQSLLHLLFTSFCFVDTQRNAHSIRHRVVLISTLDQHRESACAASRLGAIVHTHHTSHRQLNKRATTWNLRGFVRDVSGQWSAGCIMCWPGVTMEVPSHDACRGRRLF